MSSRKRNSSGNLKNDENKIIICVDDDDDEALSKKIKRSKKSPLIVAIIENNIEIVRQLLNSDKKISKLTNNTAMTHLYFAVENNNVEIVKYLIEKGYRKKLSIQENHILVRKCIVNDCLDIVKCLINSKMGINDEDSKSETLLHSAAFYGRLDIIKYLVECGADVHVKTDYNETPFHYAIRGKNIAVIRELLNLSNAKETPYRMMFNDMAVHVAAEVGNEEILNILLDEGYSMESSFKGRKPIHAAAAFNNWKLVNLFIKAGVSIDSVTKNYESPLHFALGSGQLSAVKFLLDAGASPFKDEYYCRIRPFNMLLDKEKWNSNVPLKLMIERQVKSLRCLLNYFSENQRFVLQLIDSAFEYKAPIELLNVLFEYYVSDISYMKLNYFLDDHKNFAILIDHMHRNDLASQLNGIVDNSFYNKIKECKNFCQILVARLVLLLSVSENLKIENHLKTIIKFSINDYYKLCNEQLIIMKNTKIYNDSDVTYYDILSKPLENIANYIRCEKMVTSLESSYDKFSAYSELLKARVEKGKQRYQLIDDSINCFFNIIERKYKIQLPCLVIMTIFESLSTIDLRKMIEFCS
ncbi:ankyrin-1-like [Leptopilina boulardi]|uniref:ankyrin-1-like n=1 Tax=Leptopilina boulardi TaxID=63433 RepID=UPI0021F65E0F|nr:ankyrin-1-like [Leptopilina boulardi]